MDSIIVWLTENATVLGSLSAVVGLVLFVWAIIAKPFSRDKPTVLAPETIEQIKPNATKDGPSLTTAEFIRLRRELKGDLEEEFKAANAEGQARLRERIAELQSQIANPEPALAEAQKQISDLKDRLSRMGNEVGGERLNEAYDAFQRLDYSVADEIFAEVEERQRLEVEQASRAAFGRGEIAEAEVRWADAATHYARAARLADTLDTLYKAALFAKLAGDYKSSLRFAEDMVAKARAEDDRPNLSRALDRLATAYQETGQYEPSEALFREALQIEATDQGKTSRTYATYLNNLALVVKAQGRYVEAEGLYREALEITRATIGEGHPDYATRLNNLAGVVEAQGRFAEAEGLYREALEVTRATVGEKHPSYAIRLVNLGSLLGQTGRATEGREMLEQALGIFRATLPEDHPNIAATLGHIADLPDTP
ncbi:tetratricopeptide repeat protein [Ascidiaceihabitans sp.]|uniref:tetratricopeptide repeat protein n=1 Tax=Ascidiaceihabitans sp. TaxID=1872644 RepID=UPI003298EFD5